MAPQSLSTLRGIPSLPAGLLARVFHYCDDFDPEASSEGYLDWIAVLRTCRHWYYAGAGCSSLWRTVCFSRGQSWVLEVVKRSRGTPLAIAILKYEDIEATRLLLDRLEAGRVRALYISVDMSQYDAFAGATGNLAAALAHLERLDMRAVHSSADDDLHLPDFFPYRLPSLIHLHITAECDVSGIPDVPALESLSIHNSAAGGPDSGGTVDVEELLEALRRMPRLQHLSLAGILPIFDDEVDAMTIAKTDLPELRSLCLRGHAGEYTALCDFLSVPTRARIALKYELDDCSFVDGVASSAAKLFSRTLPSGRTECRELRSLAISDTARGFTIRGSSYLTGADSTLHGDFKFTCTLFGGWRRPRDDPNLADFLTLFETAPLSNVCALSIVGPVANGYILPVRASDALFPNIVPMRHSMTLICNRRT
ncbi:F-box protein [Phanerochaete sordida]|uniref:F-box protein n=1 Tax=Phanerochaete sordida TaxID=48140 RepID=A0A9P3GFB9_9APHY|nr:F-box protein [Phanerochaete sordida]